MVRIAGEAARKIRPESILRRIKGTVENHRGWAVYSDFEGYFEKQRKEGNLKLTDWSAARLRFFVRETLREAGWERVPRKHRETRFYEPVTGP